MNWKPDPDLLYEESDLLASGLKHYDVLQLRADIYNTSGREPDAFLGGIVLNYMLRTGQRTSEEMRELSMDLGTFCGYLGLMMGDVTEVLERRRLMRKPQYPRRGREESAELRVRVGSCSKFMQIAGVDEDDEEAVTDKGLEQALRVLSNGKQRIFGPSDSVTRRYSAQAEQAIYPIDPEQFHGVDGIVGSWQNIAIRLFYAANRGEFDFAEGGPQEKDGYVYFLTAGDIRRYCFHPEQGVSWRIFIEALGAHNGNGAREPGANGRSA